MIISLLNIPSIIIGKITGRVVFLFSCILFFVFLGFNQLAATEYKHITLQNGIEAYLVKTSSPIVTSVVAYSVGAMEEQSSQEGIAHLLEHVMFLGTNRYSKEAFASFIKSTSATYNAFTSHDITLYYIALPNIYLEEAIKIEADRMQWILLDNKAVENEKLVVNEERNMYQNTPYNAFQEVLRQHTFPTTNYSSNVIGYQDSFNKITAKDLKDFYKKWYTPNNAKVLVIGNIDFNETEKYIKKYYGKVDVCRECSVIRPNYLEEPYNSVVNVEYKSKKINQEIGVISYIMPSYISDASEAKTVSKSTYVLYKILSSNSGRLYKDLVMDKKVVVDLWISYDFDQKGHSDFSIGVVPKEGVSTEEALVELRKSLNNILLNGLSDSEINLAKQKIRDDMEFLKEDNMDYVVYLARFLNAGVAFSDILKLDKDIREVKNEDVNKVYKTLIESNYIRAKALKG